MPAPIATDDVLPGMKGLHPCTRTWFGEALEAPTRIQREAWPVLASGASALLLAPTGSGKTLAAFLAAIDQLMFAPVQAPPPSPESLRDGLPPCARATSGRPCSVAPSAPGGGGRKKAERAASVRVFFFSVGSSEASFNASMTIFRVLIFMSGLPACN